MTHPRTRRATRPDRLASRIDPRGPAGLQEGSGGLRRGWVLAVAAVLVGLSNSSVLAVDGPEIAPLPPAAGPAWDPSRYIDINEIRPGMEGYCLTCFSGTQPERFALKVVSVVRDIEPGRDAVLVMGTDERFIHTGPVGGCSGSPVYLDGRMAGALAFGWSLSKDPLYGVTPIRQMLEIGAPSPRSARKTSPASGSATLSWDYSRPIDLTRFESRLHGSKAIGPEGEGGHVPMPCTLVVSGLPAEACEQMASGLADLGLRAVPAVGGREGPGDASDKVSLAPGTAMMIPLVDGDVRMAVLGTVTEVEGDKVYGFGHNFLGCGPIDLPLATARVHTVVSTLAQSFKIGSVLDVVGAITRDEPRGVVGRVGQRARTLPLRVEVTGVDPAQVRRFDCRLAYHKTLTPELLRAVLAGTALYFGNLPPDHAITYAGSLELDSGRVIRFSNVSSGMALSELIADTMGTTALLMDNPFREIPIRRAQFDLSVADDNRISSLYAIDVSDRKVKPGQEIVVGAVVESYPAVRRRFEFKMPVPRRIEPGEYTLTVCGAYEYLQILKHLAPYRFLARDSRTLTEALEYLLSIRRDRLYCLLELPASGVAMERHELPDLPATKALVLESVNRTIAIQPFQPWIERSLEIHTITADRETLKITVEKP